MLRVTFEETSTFYSDKTTLQQYLSVFDGFTKQIVLLDTY